MSAVRKRFSLDILCDKLSNPQTPPQYRQECFKCFENPWTKGMLFLDPSRTAGDDNYLHFKPLSRNYIKND